MTDIDIAQQEDLDDHNEQHEDGGSDEIDVTGLSGVLSDQQDPQSHGNERHTENFIPDTEVGANSGVASLDSNGVLVSGQVPDLSITEVFTVTAEADLTTLSNAEIGDVGLVTGGGDDTAADSFILTGPFDTQSNWVRIKTPQSPVQSVNGNTGDVNLGAADVNAPTTTAFNSHSSRHEDGGADEISVQGLSGDLADAQDPKSHDNAAHTENFANEGNYQSHDHSGSNSDQTDLSPDKVDADSQLDPPSVATRGDIPNGQTGIYYVEDEDTLTYRVS